MLDIIGETILYVLWYFLYGVLGYKVGRIFVALVTRGRIRCEQFDRKVVPENGASRSRDSSRNPDQSSTYIYQRRGSQIFLSADTTAVIGLFVIVAIVAAVAAVYFSVDRWAKETGRQGLRAQYFDGTELQGDFFERIDAAIDFDWGENVPGVGDLGADNYSVRWTGRITPEHGGRHAFHTLSDDGVRLWIDGRQLIDDWRVHPAEENTATIDLEQGRTYNLKLEYFEAAGEALVKLMWTTPGGQKAVIPASAFTRAPAADNDLSITSKSKNPTTVDPRAEVKESATIDLMSEINAAYLAVNGGCWTLKDGVLRSPENKDANLLLPGGRGITNYTLTVTVERKAQAQEALSVMLPMGGRMGAFYLDGYPQQGFASVLSHHQRTDAPLPPTIKGLQIERGAPHQLQFSYQGDKQQGELVVRIDGGEFYRWKGDLTVLRIRPGLKGFPAGGFGFSSHFPEWQISEIRIASEN